MKKISTTTARTRLLFSALGGIIIGITTIILGELKYAPLAAWDTAAIIYVVSVLASVIRFDPKQTKQHALAENPGRGTADILLIITSIASLVAVGVLLIDATNASGIEKTLDIALGLASVVVSWSVVHTLYLLEYARLYHGNKSGGIDFNNKTDPQYTDFAYLAFTVGMTFQVSDTQVSDKEIRKALLKHALLAYLFGTVIIATTINTLASLSK